MTDLVDRVGVALHPIELDLLCEFAEVQPPFPIELPLSARTGVERSVLFRGAAATLAERGLADERGPLDVAEEFVYLLRACTGAVDLVVHGPDGRLGVAVLTAADEALVVTQEPGHDKPIRLHPTTLDNAVIRLARAVPRLDAPPTAPFSLPRAAVRAAFEAMLDRVPPGGDPVRMGQAELDALVAEHGVDERVVRRMESALHPVLGSGQAGAARRDSTEDQWRRVGEEVRWVDTPRGRLRLAGDDDWMSVNPMDADELWDGLRGLGAVARG